MSKRIYFASDLHLGSPPGEPSRERERYFVRWLDHIQADCAELYLMGDVFDFWFEYKKAVPKGYVRLFGKLAEFQDAGIPIHFFAGNHDLWLGNYFTEQFGAQLYYEPVLRKLFGKTYLLAHGDGLGPGDRTYKLLKSIFRNPICQWLFHRLHPNFGIGLADYFSRNSRKKNAHKDAVDHGEKEFLLIYAREQLRKQPEIDYLVFGHRHLPKKLALETEKYYINLGDWIQYFTYLVVDAEGAHLMHFPLHGEPQPFMASSPAQ